MNKFTLRSNEIEIMDNLSFAGEEMDQTLRELNTINILLGGNHVTINGIDQLLNQKEKAHSYTIVDLGCGGGDMLKLIAKFAKRNHYSVSLTGIDANAYIISYARKNTKEFPNIHYQAIDIFSDEFKQQQFDIVTSTLFFHHFSDEKLIEFFSQIKQQARVGIVINDLHRHWFAYHSIKLLTRWFSKSPMVQNDGPISVLRAFRKHELKDILKKAGIANYSIRWKWAFRWQIVIANSKLA